MALATRCPHCDTVFRLDPHLLAPHDGRVRCGHCQEIFDAAHYQFDRDETVMAALAATAPNYGADPASPWAEKSSAEVSGDKRDALGIPPRGKNSEYMQRTRGPLPDVEVPSEEAITPEELQREAESKGFDNVEDYKRAVRDAVDGAVGSIRGPIADPPRPEA